MANAQTCSFPCTSLDDPLFAASDIISIQDKSRVYGKSGTNYKDVKYKADALPSGSCFDEGDPDINCTTDYQNTLFYHVYYPNPDLPQIDYEDCPLPAIIFFHGGGFSDCSQITDNHTYAIEWARRGFVVFNVEYRRGRVLDEINASFYSAQQVLAFYRAFQDGRGAIRSIIKRQINHANFNEDDYQINTNFIFLAGASAGSAIALNVAYYPTQSMIDQVFPGVKAVLGNINIDYYYGDLTTDYTTSVKGVINMWGNAFVPPGFYPNVPDYFTTYLNNPNSVFPPMISFHGKDDQTAPYFQQFVYFSPSGNPYNSVTSTTACLPDENKIFSLDQQASTYDIISIGSYYLYDILKGATPSKIY